MNRLAIGFFALTLTASAVPQDAAQSQSIYRDVIFGGVFEGWADKAIQGHGDDAALMVVRTLGERVPTQLETQRILGVLHLAFSSPLRPEQKTFPSAALFVLRRLELEPSGKTLSREIEMERRFVIAQTNSAETGGHANP